jgi:protein-S-isoprenylcysteine O-methyltransferase Ste14
MCLLEVAEFYEGWASLSAMQSIQARLIWGLWLLWCVYWFAASMRSKQTVRRESFAESTLHRLPVLLAVVLFLSRAASMGWLGARFLPRNEALFWLGAVMVAAGLGWSVLARVHLGGNWSAMVTVKQDHELIRTGPYRWTRRPIYTGLITAFAGSAIALGEWRGLIAVALVVVAFLRKSAVEERFMMARFPAEYPRYRAEVPALLPDPIRPRARSD